MIPVEYPEWRPHYERILREFSFSEADDRASARFLAAALTSAHAPVAANWAAITNRVKDRDVTVVGAADSAPDELRAVGEPGTLVAADGATTAVLEVGLRPDMIVTDLDGRVQDEVDAVERGALAAVHAHGDNQTALRRWLPSFAAARLVGTCQCEPSSPLRNYGGFTDGDRACHIMVALGARSVRLVGFEFEGAIGRYTGRFDPATKRRKLAVARRLLEGLIASGAPVSGLEPASRRAPTRRTRG